MLRARPSCYVRCVRWGPPNHKILAFVGGHRTSLRRSLYSALANFVRFSGMFSTAPLQTPMPALRRLWRSLTLATTLCIACGMLPSLVCGQDAPDDPADALTAESVAEQQKQVVGGIEDETQKTRINEIYQQAIDQLTRVATLQKQLEGFEKAKETAADRAQQIRNEMDSPSESPTVDGTLPLPQLEQELAEAEAEKKKLAQSLVEANELIAKRTARRKEIRDRLLEIDKQLEAVRATSTAPPADEPAAFTTAKRLETLSRERLYRTERQKLEAELAAIEAEDVIGLPTLRRDQLTQKLDLQTRLSEAWQIAASQKRKDDAQEKVESTEGQAEEEQDPLLRALAERNAELAKQYQLVGEEIEKVADKQASAAAIRDRIVAEAESAKQKEKTIGLTDAIGKLLRKQKRALPGIRTFQIEIDERNELIGEVQLELIELQEESARSVEQTVRRLATDVPPITGDRWSAAAAAVEKRNDLLDPLIRAQSTYFDDLVELSSTQTEIVRQISSFESFIDERVLWVRSSPPLFSNLEFPTDELWILSPVRWRDAGERLLADVKQNWFWYLFGFVLQIGLVRNRFEFRRRIQPLGKAAASNTCVSIWPTLSTLGLTILAAAAWPFLTAFISWRCSLAAGTNVVLRALSTGLYCAAVGYFPLDFFRLTCKPHGLAECHFGWFVGAMDTVRRTTRSITLLALPLVLISTMMNSGTDRFGTETLERLPFIAVTIAVAYYLSRLFSPVHGVFREYLQLHPDGWLNRLQAAWYWPIVGSPLILAGLSFFGYHYTAQQLAWRLFLTACLLGTIGMVTSCIWRWLFVQRRRLSIEQSRRRREALLKAAMEEEETVEDIELPSAEELRGQVQQSYALLTTVMCGVALLAIWFTWVDVLPALSFLEDHPLWESTVTVTEKNTDEDTKEVSFTTRDVIDPVTIADVIFSLFVLGLMIAAARNIPGVLEISLLQRLPIDASVRYAITTIVSYLIVLIGIIIACKAIGIHWAQVQWMATALTFGLAFGLQEMFANFVAGIIILFERPIRVGDIVTLDDVTGKVSRVQIRATTITNWDCKDYIVPNKDFITGRVLNWTLSDQVNRIVITVGVAYGSDKQRALDELKRVAVEHPLIESDPGPSVTFEGFGASSLDFVLRCYISMRNMSHRLTVVHELHTAIDDAFREADIEIAFPQQDVHIRALPPQAKVDLPSDDS